MSDPTKPTPPLGSSGVPGSDESYLDLREEWHPSSPAERGSAGDGGPSVVPPPHAPAPSTSSPPPVPARVVPRPRAGSAHVRGLARNVQHQAALKDLPRLSFRLDQYDASGNRLEPVAVELAGHSSGHIGEGEEVEAWGRWKHGSVRATRVVNVTTGAEVRGPGRPLKILTWAVGSVVVLFLLFLVVVFVRTSISDQNTVQNLGSPGSRSPAATPAATPVAVPDLRGMDNVSAAQTLYARGLRDDTSFQNDPAVPFGQVIRSNPPAGTRVSPETTVTVLVSTGPTGRRR